MKYKKIDKLPCEPINLNKKGWRLAFVTPFAIGLTWWISYIFEKIEATPAVSDVSKGTFSRDVMACIDRNEFISAIQQLRSETLCGLKEAKDALDQDPEVQRRKEIARHRLYGGPGPEVG